MIAAVPMLPLLLRYRAIHASFGFTRDFGHDPRFRRRRGGAAARDGPPGAMGMARRCSGAPEGELFPGLTIVLLVVAGALFVRGSQRRAHVSSWRWCGASSSC